jgi:hypothetical protein
VVDCCRPQRTQAVDPDIRFPRAEFEQRVRRIGELAEELHQAGHVDRVVYLRPGDELLAHLCRKYLARWVRGVTHDVHGCALTGYLAGLELPATRYVVHYDADMLLHQAAGFDWGAHALDLLQGHPAAVAATPRISAPFAHLDGAPDGPSRREGRPFSPVRGGWRNDWFSTRCFLMDRHKLACYLPLLRGRLWLEVLARKLLNRGYPVAPEILLFRRLGPAGAWMLNLGTEKAWLLHPAQKPPRYLELLPAILDAVHRGQLPDDQRGHPNVRLAAWEGWLAAAPSRAGG